MKHIAVLDGMRGWAIIFVMLYHFTIPFQQLTNLNLIDLIFAKLFQIGWLGVDLFFVMSGFLITNILIKSISHPAYYRNFYIRRVLRIFPLYYAVLIMLLIIFPLLSNSLADKTEIMQENSFWFWSYLVNWKVAQLGTFEGFQGGYMWSLAVEEQFYIFWPLIVRAFYKNLVAVSLVLLCLSLALKIILLTSGAEGTTIYTMTITHMDGLLLGSILAVFYTEKKLTPSFLKMLSLGAIWSLITIIVIAVCLGKFVFYNNIVASIGVSCASVLFCFILVKAINANANTFLHNIFTYKIVVKCGQLCYGLYLLHQPIDFLVSEKVMSNISFTIFGLHLPSALVGVAISFFISLLAAQLSYLFFESYFLKLKKYFI